MGFVVRHAADRMNLRFVHTRCQGPYSQLNLDGELAELEKRVSRDSCSLNFVNALRLCQRCQLYPLPYTLFPWILGLYQPKLNNQKNIQYLATDHALPPRTPLSAISTFHQNHVCVFRVRVGVGFALQSGETLQFVLWTDSHRVYPMGTPVLSNCSNCSNQSLNCPPFVIHVYPGRYGSFADMLAG